MMCCKVPRIKTDTFEKPAGEWCRHAVPGKGCRIYADRPVQCQTFYCRWMQDATLGPEWKPDRARFVLYVQSNNVNLQIAVDPGFPNAWTRAPYYARIKKMATDGIERGNFVFVNVGRRTIVVLPDCDKDIGIVDPEDGVEIVRRFGPAGFEYDINVRHGSAG
jgi:hypothetical protein